MEAGIYRLNRVREGAEIEVTCGRRDERLLPLTYVDYDSDPREYFLNAVTTIVDVHTRVSDLYGQPHDQDRDGFRLRQMKSAGRRSFDQQQEVKPYAERGALWRWNARSPPTPDDLDELITRVEGAGVLPRTSSRHRCGGTSARVEGVHRQP